MWLNNNKQIHIAYAWIIVYLTSALLLFLDLLLIKKMTAFAQNSNLFLFLFIWIAILKLIYFSFYLLMERIILPACLPKLKPIAWSIISFISIDMIWFFYAYSRQIFSNRKPFSDIFITAHSNFTSLYLYILPTIVYIIFSIDFFASSPKLNDILDE